MNMEKEAQSRSPIKWLGRMLNPMEYIRYFGYDSYRRVYDAITEIDNDIRGRAQEKKDELRGFLHQARMSMKNREYQKVIYYAWELLESVDGIFDRVDELEKLRSDMMAEFYASGNVSKSELEEMEKSLGKVVKPVQKPLASGKIKVPAALERLLYSTGNKVTKEGLESTAGMTEWLEENIPTWRQMEGSMLDKIFRNKMYKQKEAARKALQIAEVSFNTIKDVFSALDSARTDFSTYLSTAQRAREKFKKQKEDLSILYNEYFKATEPVVTIDQNAYIPATQPPVEKPENKPPEAPLQGDEPVQKAAEIIKQLIQKASTAKKRGDPNTAIVLLVKASEICDLYNNDTSSISILKAAKRILKDD